MGRESNIQWCDSTVNPSTGCDGCELWKMLGKRADMLRLMGGPCYAGNFHELRLARSLPDLYAPNFTDVRLAPGRMKKAAGWSDLTGTARPDKPWLDGMPRVIFVSDMSDVLSDAVPFDYLKAEIIDNVTSARGRRHVWMWLSKRPGRMAEFAAWLRDEHGIGWPANLWPGTSVTGRATLTRIDALMGVPSDRRFVSVEPLIEAVGLSPWLDRPEIDCPDGLPGCEVLHIGPPPIALVIVGGESRQGEFIPRPFDVQWARAIIGECKAAGVACLVKQLGTQPYDSTRRFPFDGPDSHAVELSLEDSHGGDMAEWEPALRVRQFPAPLPLATPEAR